jgi:FkbM family methyltransferase
LQSNARLRAFQSPTRPQKEETAPLLSTALWEQREVLTQALPRLERWREVLDDRCFEEFSPHQWVLLWAVIWDFQPDLVLQIGRGSGVMALAVQEAMLSIEGGHFVTVSTDDKLERFLLPKISPHLSDSWYEGFSLHVREPRTLPYERLLRGKERVLILWVSPEERDAELVMSSLLPAVAERSHLLALMNSGDLRFQSKEKSAEQASRKRGQERLLHLGHLCAPVAVATEILDFTTRNELVLDSGSQEILDFCDHYKLRSRELQERLGEPWFLRAGNWWWLSLSRQPQKTWQFTPNTYQFPHHPVFYELDPFRGEIPPDFLEDYVGTRVRYAFLQHKPPVRTGLHTYSDYPVMDEEYFEWIDILESVMNAGEQYVMIELGAGYGRWSARAAIAARRKGISAITLRPVEADPHHAQNLRQHFLDNGLKESEFDIVQAVVGAEESEVEFYIETSRHDDAGEEIIWYGQSKAQEHEEVARETKNKSYGGQPVLVYASGHQAIRIPQLPLSQILEGLGVVDLLDLDIQGEEWNVLSSSVELLNSQVKRIHIGTHGHELEISIRALLAQEGWICLADYPCHGTHSTPYGEIDFVDGVQSWLNPRFS